MLEGGKVNLHDPVVTIWREYRLARLFGWTPDQIDQVPGDWCDWALRISDMEGGGRG